MILSSYLFFCLPLFLCLFTVPYGVVFAKPEDLETWPNHLTFRFLIRVRSLSWKNMENMEMTRERISFTFDPRDMLLSLQMGFSFGRAGVACAILERISGLKPSSETTSPRYLKLFTVPSFCPFTFISHWMPLALFVISLVSSALISILYLVQVLSRLSTRASSCCSSSTRVSMSSANRRLVIFCRLC